MLNRLSLSLFVSLLLTLSTSAFSQSHAMIDSTRSSLYKNMFITTSVEGEYGSMERTAKVGGATDTESWKGYGIRNGLGLELFKFTQFSLSHTLVNMRSQNSGLENLNGSRIAAELALSFSAPITNIQFGLGVLGSQLQYQALAKSSTFVGTGHFYTMGMNYFVSPSVSLQAIGKRIVTTNKVSGGSSDFSQLESRTDNLSLGVAIWL